MLSTVSKIQFITEPRSSFRAAAAAKNETVGSFDATQILIARKWAAPDELQAEMVVPTGWALDHLPNKDGSSFSRRARYVSVAAPTGRTMIFLLTEADLEELDDEHSRLSIKGSSPEAWLTSVPSTVDHADETLLPRPAPTVADWVSLAARQYSLAWDEETSGGVAFRDLPIVSTRDAYTPTPEDTAYYGKIASFDRISTSFTDGKPAAELNDISGVDDRPWPAPLGDNLFKLLDGFPYTLAKSEQGATVEYRSEFELQLAPTASPYDDDTLWWRWQVHPREDDQVVYISRQSGSITGSSTLHMTAANTDALVYPPDYSNAAGATLIRRSQARFSSSTPAPGPWSSVTVKAAESGEAKPETIDAVQAFKQAAAEKAGFEPAVTIDCTANGDSENLRDETYRIRPGVTAALRFSNAVLKFAVEEVDYSYAETGWSISIPLTIRTNHVDFTYYGDDSYDEYSPDDSFEGPGDTPEPPDPPDPPEPGLHAGKVDWIAGRYSSAYDAPELLIRTEDGKLYASPAWHGDAGQNPDWLTLVKPVPLEPEIVQSLITTGYSGGLLRATGHDRDFWVVLFPDSQSEPTVKHGLAPEGETVITGSSTGSWIMTGQCAYKTSGDSELTLTPVEAYPMIGTERVIQAGDYYIFVGKKQLWKWRSGDSTAPVSLGLARGGGWKQVTATADGQHVIAIDAEGARIDGEAQTGVLEGVVGAAGDSYGYFLWKDDSSHTLLAYEHGYIGDDPSTVQLPFTPSAAIVSYFPMQIDDYSGVIFYGNGGAVYLHKKTEDTWEQKTLTTEPVLAACGAGTPESTILCTANGAIVGAGTAAQATLTDKKVISCAGRAGIWGNTTNTIVAVLVTESGEALTVTQQRDGSYSATTLTSSGAKQALGLRWPCIYVVGDDAAWQVDSSDPIYEGSITGASLDEKRGYLTLMLESGDAARYYPGKLNRAGEEKPAEPLSMVTHHVLPITLTNGSFWGSAGEGWTGESNCAYTIPGLDGGLQQVSGVRRAIWVTDAGDAYWISPYWLGDSSFNDAGSYFLRAIQLDGYDYEGGDVLGQDPESSVDTFRAIAWRADGSYKLFQIKDGSQLGPSPVPAIEFSPSDLHFDSEETVLGVIDGKVYSTKARYSYNGSIETALQPELLVEPITSVAKWRHMTVARAKNDGKLVSLDDTWSDSSGQRYFRLTGFTGTVLENLSASSELLVTTDGYWKQKSRDHGQIIYEKVAADGPIGTPLSGVDMNTLVVTTTGVWKYGYQEGSSDQTLYKTSEQLPEAPTGCWRPSRYYSGPTIISTATGLYSYSSGYNAKIRKFSGEQPKEGLKVVGGSVPAVLTASGELWLLKLDGSAFRVAGDYSEYTALLEPDLNGLMVATGGEGALAFYAVEAPKPLPCLMVGDTFWPAPPATGDLQPPATSEYDGTVYTGVGDATSAAACLYTVNGTRLDQTAIFSSGINGDVIDGSAAGRVIITTEAGYTMSASIAGGETGEIITVPRGDDKYYEFVNDRSDLEAVVRQKGSAKPEAYHQNEAYEMVWSELTKLPASAITGWWPSDQYSTSKLVSFKDGSCWLLNPGGYGQPPACRQVWAAGTGEPTDVGVANYAVLLAISPDGRSVTRLTDLAVFTAPEGKELVACKGETILGSDGTIYGMPNDGTRVLWASEDERFYKPDGE